MTVCCPLSQGDKYSHNAQQPVQLPVIKHSKSDGHIGGNYYHISSGDSRTTPHPHTPPPTLMKLPKVDPRTDTVKSVLFVLYAVWGWNSTHLIVRVEKPAARSPPTFGAGHFGLPPPHPPTSTPTLKASLRCIFHGGSVISCWCLHRWLGQVGSRAAACVLCAVQVLKYTGTGNEWAHLPGLGLYGPRIDWP